MLRKLILAGFLALLAFAAVPAQAQPVRILSSCGTISPAFAANTQIGVLTMDVNGNLCTAASVSASITGFPTVQSTGTPISVTTSSATGTLPSGAVVVASNVGATNGAYCKLGASATTSDQLIPPNSWFAFTVGANTQLTCITSASTTTVNMVGGSGLPTGSGGGGGGGGGGGAITAASGSYASGALSSGSIAAGAMVDLLTMRGTVAAGTAAANSLLTGCIYNSSPITLTTGQGAAVQCSVNGYPTVVVSNTQTAVTPGDGITTTIYGTAPASPVIGVPLLWNGTTYDRQKSAGATGVAAVRPTDGTRNAIVDPCEATLQTYAPISITTATTTRIVAPSASNKTYICHLFLTSAAADNVGIVEGTGGTCGTGTAGVIGGTTAANGPNFAANGGVALHAGGKVAVAQTAGTNVDLCLITSAATPLAGGIKYVQAP